MLSAYAAYSAQTKGKEKSNKRKLQQKPPHNKRKKIFKINNTSDFPQNIAVNNKESNLIKKETLSKNKLIKNSNISFDIASIDEPSTNDEKDFSTLDEPPQLMTLKEAMVVKRKSTPNKREQLKHQNKFIENDLFLNSDQNEPKLNSEKIITIKKKVKKSKNKPNKRRVSEIDSDVISKPIQILNYLLAPVKLSEFINSYWETKPLHISRNNADYFKNLLTSKQLDTILRENLLYYTKNVDVVTYENGERQTLNPEGRAMPTSVWDFYMNGCSVRIMNPQTYNQKVRDLLSTLEEYFGTKVGVNVYLTPPGSQGFAPHYDDIEAFVIQLEGRKHWRLYAPRYDSELLTRYSSKNLSRDELQEPIKELTLETGDLLYFPRGFIHEASTDNDSHSLHITVSVYQNTAYADLLENLLPEALKLASEQDIEFRKGLPLNYLKHVGIVNADKKTATRQEVIKKARELIRKLANYAPVDKAADQLGRKFMHDALPPHLSLSERERSNKEDGDTMENGIVSNIGVFGPDTCVRLARYYCLRLVKENDGFKIYYCTENAYVHHGEDEKYLELDDTLVDTVKALQNNYPQYISIEKLPGAAADECNKIQLISDLWENGLIVTKIPLEIDDI